MLFDLSAKLCYFFQFPNVFFERHYIKRFAIRYFMDQVVKLGFSLTFYFNYSVLYPYKSDYAYILKKSEKLYYFLTLAVKIAGE